MAVVFIAVYFLTFLFDPRIAAVCLLIAIVMLCRGAAKKQAKRKRAELLAPAAQPAWSDPWGTSGFRTRRNGGE